MINGWSGNGIWVRGRKVEMCLMYVKVCLGPTHAVDEIHERE